jgi:hypothetical protein
MRTRITAKWLKKKRACTLDEENRQAEELSDVRLVVEELMKQDRFNDANWLITRKLNVGENRMYAINAAKLSLPIYEKEYSDDDIPHKAIEAAERYLKHKTKKNKEALIRAAKAVHAAIGAAVAAADAAVADADAAVADADAAVADAAADAAVAYYVAKAAVKAAVVADAGAAYYVANTAVKAAVAYANNTVVKAAYYAAIKVVINIKKDIINYGLKLLYKEV